MNHKRHYIIDAHVNSETFDSATFSFSFRDIDVMRYKINGREGYAFFKERLEAKLQSGPIYQISYRSPFVFDNN